MQSTRSNLLTTSVHGTPELAAAVAQLRNRGEADLTSVAPAVSEILAAVQRDGEKAVLAYVERFEGRKPASLVVDGASLASRAEAALARLPREARESLEVAAKRITAFHERERTNVFVSFRYEEGGVTLGLRVRAMARVGVYAPGGKARYPSSVLMSAIPAKVAGVREIVLATPLTGDSADDALLAAAYLSGVTTVLDAGGAQAIAALAYGLSPLLPRVDKVVGPGNLYVACAKRLVFGAVAIDSIAGPSEILVVADKTADAARVAADLLSQAEHDEDAYPLLVTDSRDLAAAVEAELARQLADLPRAGIAHESLRRHGQALIARDRAEMAELADAIAAEHLSLQVDDPEGLFDQIPSAGAAFLGSLTPEAVGDYLAGPSHVLPTGGAVRFGSPLGVHDFVARTSIIRYSADALRRDERAITTLARLEGLEAHARAVTVRNITSARAGPDGQARVSESRS